jgi:hypothetical protein
MILDSMYFVSYRWMSDQFAKLSENMHVRALAHYVCLATKKPIKPIKLMGNTFYVVYRDKWKDQTFRVVFVGTGDEEQDKKDFMKTYPFAEIQYFDNILQSFTAAAYAIQKVEET